MLVGEKTLKRHASGVTCQLMSTLPIGGRGIHGLAFFAIRSGGHMPVWHVDKCSTTRFGAGLSLTQLAQCFACCLFRLRLDSAHPHGSGFATRVLTPSSSSPNSVSKGSHTLPSLISTLLTSHHSKAAQALSSLRFVDADERIGMADNEPREEPEEPEETEGKVPEQKQPEDPEVRVLAEAVGAMRFDHRTINCEISEINSIIRRSP
eukprot:g10231.t1